MRILVIGSGAVGGYYGAVLHKGGHDVTFVARGQHLEAIRQEGLRIESVSSGDFTIHPTAADRPAGSWKADMVLFCVKAYDNGEAITIMAPAVGQETAILTLQNGIGSGDELAVAFGWERVLLGATYVDSTRRAPGVVSEVGGPANIVFGEQGGSRSPRAEAVLDALGESGIAVELSTDVAKALWTKLVYICAVSGMTCVTRAPFAEVLETPETLELTWRVMREAETVARARGIGLDDDIVEKAMAGFQEVGGRFVSSMFTDLERGNPLEVDVLNGAVSRLGKELGVDTPVNDFIAGCLAPAHNGAVARRASRTT